VVDDTDHEKSTWVIEYGPFELDNDTHPIQGLISYMDNVNEKEKTEWKEPKILTS
jgi:hypothetical protein